MIVLNQKVVIFLMGFFHMLGSIALWYPNTNPIEVRISGLAALSVGAVVTLIAREEK
jgi:hypothetical protein